MGVPARVGVVTLLVALLVAVLQPSSGEHHGAVLRDTLAGQEVRLSMPAGEGRPKGIAVWFHGQGGNADNRVEGPWLDALRRDGWAVASSDFHETSWGNAASTDDTRRLVEWSEEQTGLEVKLWVSGSMGGAVSLNALNFGVRPPPCWYGVKPAISLTQMNNVPGGRRYIATAFRGPVPPERDPVRNLRSLPTEPRYRVVASKDDHWVIFDQNSGPLIATLTQRGADISWLRVTGLHDDPSHWNVADLVEFADSCAGETGTARAASR